MSQLFPGKDKLINFILMGVNLTQIFENPLYKGLEASEVECFNLTPTSPEPHFYLMQP